MFESQNNLKYKIQHGPFNSLIQAIMQLIQQGRCQDDNKREYDYPTLKEKI